VNQLQLVASILPNATSCATPRPACRSSAALLHAQFAAGRSGIARLVEFEIAALAAGEISGRFASAELGAMYQFTGFLARKKPQQQSPGVSHH
jgi:primosomal replication protein N